MGPIQELGVFPQTTLSEGQGQTGTRQWCIDYKDLDEFLTIVCASHFPGYPDSLPIQIQSGEFWDGTQIGRASCRERV
jgi:hypothetical protein